MGGQYLEDKRNRIALLQKHMHSVVSRITGNKYEVILSLTLWVKYFFFPIIDNNDFTLFFKLNMSLVLVRNGPFGTYPHNT
jgi:hypothetical protein